MPFSPTDLTNLWAWFKGDAGVGVSVTDATSWADQSGNGNNFSLANPSWPLNYIASGLNGLPTIGSKSTASNFGTFLTGVNLPALTDATIYIVAKQKAGEGLNRVFLQSNSNFRIMRHDAILTNAIIGEATGSSDTPAIAATNNTFYTARLRITAGTLALALNNGSELSGVSFNTPSANPLAAFGTGDKEIAEIIIYTANHTSLQSDQVEAYLHDKYLHYSAAAVITFGALANKNEHDPDFTLSASSTSPAAITFASSNPAVATISGTTVHIVGPGTTNITASQGATTGYAAASDVIQSLTINTMSTPTTVQGRSIPLAFSLDGSTYKNAVCLKVWNFNGDTPVSREETQCGSFPAYGELNASFDFELLLNTTPNGATEISADTVYNRWLAKTQHYAKVQIGSRTIKGYGAITNYKETGSTGQLVTVTGTFTFEGDPS